MDKAFAYPFLGLLGGRWNHPGLLGNKHGFASENPGLDLLRSLLGNHTRSEERPPVKCIPPGELINSMASNGCVIKGTVSNSVLSPGCVC